MTHAQREDHPRPSYAPLTCGFASCPERCKKLQQAGSRCLQLLARFRGTGGGVCHLASKENPCTSVRSALLLSRVLPPWPSAPAVGPAPPPRPTPAPPARARRRRPPVSRRRRAAPLLPSVTPTSTSSSGPTPTARRPCRSTPTSSRPRTV